MFHYNKSHFVHVNGLVVEKGALEDPHAELLVRLDLACRASHLLDDTNEIKGALVAKLSRAVSRREAL